MTIADWISAYADTDRVVFRFEGESISYFELANRIRATANGLHQAGVGPGDRVASCGLNRVEGFEVLFAAASLGAIFVPLNNRLTAGELGAQISDSAPSLLVATDGFSGLLREAAPDAPIRDLDDDPFTSNEGTGESAPAFMASPETTVLMVYTSGTTGRARGAMLSHDALRFTVLNGIDHQDLTADDRVLAPLPTFHVGGLAIQTLPTLYVGGEVLLQRRFDPADVLALVPEHRVTQTLLVPAMLSAVASHPHFGDSDLSSLRGINTGSSIVPAEVMQPYFDRGVPIGQVYGTTETGPTSVVLRYDEAADHIGSCGRAATHTELRIVANDAGTEVDATVGQPGELWLRGPNIFTGYWGDPEATNEAFAAGGWFRTGDVGYRDDDGYTFITDRIKDVVISGGENIFPAELEAVLVEHPAIGEVAVVGQRDDRWGEVPVAVVTLVEGASLELADLREWCDGRLARFKHPRRLRVVDALPRTALGKVKKHELRRN